MALNAEESVTYRVQCAFNYPLVQRCSELTKLMDQCSFKEAHSLFPVVVESVFGFGNHHPGWGLNHHHLQPREFDSVRQFVSPEGPLVLLAYRLMNDGYLKYEFPVSCLPSIVIRSIEDGVVPQFYFGKLQAVSPGHRIPNFLLLNPFEFFVFHLSYFLIKSQNQKTYLDWSNGGDALYAFTIEDYLQYFLPCSGSFPPPPPCSLNSQASVTSTKNQFNRFVGKVVQSSKGSVASNLTSIFKSPERDRQPTRNLFKQPSVTRQPSTVGPQPRDAAHVELWRSEVFVQALVEFWLDHYTVETQRGFHSSDKSRSLSSNQWSPGSDNPWISDVTSNRSFLEPFFPSIDHVRLLRMCIKHFHYFANSARSNSNNNFDEFKRAVIPQLVQKKLYAFIRHMFNHWPLDASFRLVLEMWLSYIQPWRYVGGLSIQSSPKVEEIDRVVLSKWRPFVEENLLFYTLFFQKMIPRLFRVDLCTVKNASMLHRVTKVFSQANVEKIIREAEALLHEQYGRSLGGLSPSVGHSILARSATEAGHAGLIRQHVSELEGPAHVYVPLFGEEVTNQIKQLHQLIQRAKETITEGQQSLSKMQPKRGFFSSFWSFLEMDGRDGGDSGSASDAHKVEQYLDMALTQIGKLFQIQVVFHRSPLLKSFGSPETPRRWADSSPQKDDILTERGTLTPHGRYQLLNRMCEPEHVFRGDPDRQPIRSYEIAFLVRLLFQFALTINRKFALDIQTMYERHDFVGRFCRQFIQPPTVCYTFQNYGTPSTREKTILPPRISLRALGSKQNIGYIFGILLVAHLYGYGVFSATFFMVAVVILVASFRAVVEPFRKVFE